MLGVVGEELRRARRGAGLSQRVVGRASGLSHSTISRIESGGLPHASIAGLARIGAVVGLQVSLRTYPGGDPLRDAGHLKLLARFRRHVSADLSWRTEVPLPIEGDRRARDAVIRGPTFRIGVEAETRVIDAQAISRKLSLKRRDGGVDSVVLVLAATATNRAAAPALISAFGDQLHVDARTIIDALQRGTNPGGSGIVIM
jgi:transcriptional regulator with XRE-family HTH domain